MLLLPQPVDAAADSATRVLNEWMRSERFMVFPGGLGRSRDATACSSAAATLKRPLTVAAMKNFGIALGHALVLLRPGRKSLRAEACVGTALGFVGADITLRSGARLNVRK